VNIRFAHPEYLWALASVPVVAAVLWTAARWRRRAVSAAGDAPLLRGIGLDARSQGFGWRSVVFIIAVALAAVAWAGPYSPRAGRASAPAARRDVVVALDVSKSMTARDAVPDRLHAARRFVEALAEAVPEDRVALVVFAGRAYVQLPLTADRAALQTVLSTLRPESAPTGGTALADALHAAGAAFAPGAATGRVVVLVSDGEDHGGGAPAAARELRDATGAALHAVGVGSPAGTTLYDPATGAPRTDAEGAPIVSKLDAEGLQALAREGGGQTFSLRDDPAGTAARVAAAVRRTPGVLQRGDEGGSDAHFFQLLLLPAVLLLLLAWMPRRRTLPAACVAVMASAVGARAQDADIRRGNAAYRKGDYNAAAEAYRQALSADSTDVRARFNRGAALYQQKKWEEARKALSAAAAAPANPAARAAASYNIGNAWASEEQWQQAVDAYRDALRRQPGDAAAQYNLSYALAKLKQQQDQQKQNDKKDDQKQQQQPQQSPQQQRPQERRPEEQKPAPGAMPKEQAERVLAALREQEKKQREKQRDAQPSGVRVEKDW